MKKILLFVLLMPFLAIAQDLVTEDFNYGSSANTDITTVASSQWARHSGAQGPQYVTTSLSYANFSNPGIGGAMSFTKGASGINDGDVNISFTPQTSGSVYAAFLVSFTSVTATGDYFFNFMNSGSGFVARTFVKNDGSGNISFGLNKASTTGTVYTSAIYSLNTTYLIVIKYTFNTGSTTDDQVDLFVNPTVPPGTEPTPNLTFTTGTDNASINQIAIRQGSNTPDGIVDHMVVSNSWTEVLPISLTSFTGKESNNSILLNWITASEKNNKNFEILRSTDGKSFKNIGTVDGAGNSDTQRDYSFTDANPFGGTNYYQLKQIDFDGRYSNSAIIAVNSKIATAQLSVYAEASTVNIKITSPNETAGKIALFDITGRKLREQSIHLNKGYNVLQLNETLSPGLHFINLTTDGEVVKYKFIKQ